MPDSTSNHAGTVVRYSGINHHGRAQEGTISGGRERVPWWVEGVFFEEGWRTLSVTIDGEEVGGIRQDENTRRRTWWVTA